MKLFFKEMSSPIGRLKLVASDVAVVAVIMETESADRVYLAAPELAGDHPLLLATETQLNEYFAGRRKVFELPFKPEGTEFQNKVWRALSEIPFGETRSYGELARAIAQPKASRAVGAANGRNPLGIIIPCHRVIGADGTLTGYGGGLPTKEKLLQHERAVQGPCRA